MSDQPVTGRRLAILIPARDEALRLPRALEDFATALRDSPWELVAILVADNGSSDETTAVAEQLGRDLRLPVSARTYPVRGKAAAVCAGLVDMGVELAGHADWVLVADADGATDPIVLRDLMPAPEELWVASRHMAGASITRPAGFSLSREVMSAAMRLLVRALFGFPLDDTQCGFKLIPIAFAERLGSAVRSRSWVFDVELLARARDSSLLLVPFPVRWTDIAVSKVSPFRDSAISLVDLLAIRMRLLWERLRESDDAAVASVDQGSPGSAAN